MPSGSILSTSPEHYRADMMGTQQGMSILGSHKPAVPNASGLGYAVTVLRPQDPGAVYTEFATLDAVSDAGPTHRRSRFAHILFRFSGTTWPITGHLRGKLDFPLTGEPAGQLGGQVPVRADQPDLSPPLPETPAHVVGVGQFRSSVATGRQLRAALMLPSSASSHSFSAPLVDLYKRAPTNMGIRSCASYAFARLCGEYRHEAEEIQWPHWASFRRGPAERGWARPTRIDSKPRSTRVR